MGLYSRDTTEQLNTLRTELRSSLHQRLTQPTEIDHGGSRAKYDQRTADIKREISAIDNELDRREGVPAQQRTFYLV